MKKITLLFLTSLLVNGALLAQDYPSSSWSDNTDTDWYNENQDEFDIDNAEELAGLSELVANGNDFDTKTINLQSDIDLDAHLWSPIGPDNDAPFSGTLNGNDNTISNLMINAPDGDFIGLIGYGDGMTLTDIIIDTSNITTRDTSGTLAGNIFGNSTVENCHATNVSITATSYNIGGLIGSLVLSDVNNCSVSGAVEGVNQVGGLAGSVYNNATISQSYSEGSVSGSHLIGGFVGYSTFAPGPGTKSTVNNCYSRASVDAEQGRAGGFFGGSDGDLILKNSYSTGIATAPELVGGFIGALGNPNIEITNNYFDTESSELDDGVGDFVNAPPFDYDISGKTTAEMQSQNIIDSLNNESADGPWSFIEGENDGYPVLESSLSTPDVKEDNSSIVLYPTQFDSRINISSELNLTSYRVYSYAGALVDEGSLKNTDHLELGNLSTGVYLIKIDAAQKGSVTKKVIKK